MKMKLILLWALLSAGTLLAAQDVQYNYDRNTSFGAFKTYQWVDAGARGISDPLLDRDICRAIDAQLAQKGLQTVERDGELYITYYTVNQKERRLDAWGMGPRWSGFARANTSTIDIGKLVIEIFDPAKKQVVWRGVVSKELQVSKDPDKNYRNLEKAVAKLLQNYPPKSKRN
jgi:hypothetical protein